MRPLIQRPIRLLALLAVLALPAAGIAACGGDNSSASASDAQAVLRQTFGPSHPIRSGRLDLGVNIDAKGIARLSGPLDLRLSGPFQSNGAGTLPDFQFALDVNAGGRTFSAGAVSTGKAGFLTIEGQAFDVGAQLYQSFKKGYEQASQRSKGAGGTPTLGALGIDPMQWLREAEVKGTEDVGGAATDHVAAQVDVPKFVDDLSRLLQKAQGLQVQGAGAVPKALTAQQRRDIVRSVKSATVDVWSGRDDHTLRKLALAVDLDVPQDVRAKVGGLQSGRIAFGFTIADLNKPQTITAPPGARPLTQLTGMLRQLGLGAAAGAGSGSGSGGSGSSAGGSASGAAPGKQQKYLNCLQKAGTDVARIQKCANLLAP